MIRRMLGSLAALLLASPVFSQITTGTVSPTTYCAGASINVPFTSVGVFTVGNVYTAEISDATGTFIGTTLGSLVSTSNSGTIAGIIPSTLGAGSNYRVRVRSSAPALTGTQSVSVLTITALGINAPTFAGTTFCPGAALNVAYTLVGSCPFPNTPSANVFTAELSDQFGNYPGTNIGTLTSSAAGTIATVIPTTMAAGNGYKIRVKSSNPGSGLISAVSVATITINAIALNAPTTGATTYCAGATFNVAYTFVSSCNFLSGNTFTAQLSDAAGVFPGAPQVIGTVTTQNAGNISVTIPTTQPAGTGYKIRVVASNRAVTSTPTAANITINQFGINAPTFTGTSFCQGSSFIVAYTIQNGCTFPNTPAANVFTAQLSDASGSFASPATLGTNTSNNNGNITATIPVGTPAGSGYRIRVVSSNPTVVVSADNGTNISVAATSGNPTVYGTTAWNAYAYSGTAFPITNNLYMGTYTENNLSFATTSRWANSAGPGVADGTSGSAYAGCPIGGTSYSMSFKRTNFTCGYYQIDIPSHDDDMRLFVNGVLVFSHVAGCCDSHTNTWTGFLGATSQVDVQFINFGGPGNLQIAINAATVPITTSPPAIICSGSNTTLTASSPVPLTYAWTPTATLTPSTGIGASVVANPTITTTYTVTGTDATTSCTQQRTVLLTVVAPATVPTLTVTNTAPTICSGINTSTLSVSGANTYTWSPGTGLSATTGTSVIANPATTTTYTVTGSTGCQSNTSTTTVTVQNVPATPVLNTFGNGVWNVFNHNNTTFSNYYGFYSENSLSFNTTTRWTNTNGPSTANAASGTAYTGCSFPGINYSMSFRRTNFTCGYYTLDINYQDDQFTMLVDGVQVFQNNAFTNTVQTGVWRGFLGPASQVELRLVNGSGPGQLQVTFTAGATGPQILSPNVIICAGTSTNLTATAASYPGATYAWTVSPTDPSLSFSPGANMANPTFQTTGATPGTNYTLTNTMTDAGGTGCTASKTTIVTVDPLPATAVTPTSATLICPTQTITLTATGANTYTWSPSTGLSATTGNTVIAQPATTTTYTVTGSNNCVSNSAPTTITVVPLVPFATFPTNTWNVYGFNATSVGTNYQGYYTDNGTGPTGYSFNTQTRWTSGGAPSTATASNGNAWVGCTMPVSNIALSFKRTNFTCGTYQIDVPAHDDNFTLLINGNVVSQHNGCCDSHTNVWTGILTASSTVEFQLLQGGGGSYLQATFTAIAQPAGTTTWIGATSTDWFTASNWCSAIPTATTDAIIPAAGPTNFPLINGLGAVVRNLTISPAIPASGFSAAVPAASLTMNTFNLDINGNLVSTGTFNANGGTVSFVGSSAGNTISSNGTLPLNNVVISKSNGITFSSGTMTIAGTMTLTNGVLTQNGTLRFLAGSAVTGTSNSSYVDGPIAKVGNTAFVYPFGKGGLYRPLGISAPATISDAYTAQYFNTNPTGTYPNANRASSLDHVSGAEYWTLNRTSGSSAVNVMLSWNTNSGGVGNLPTLRVAAWNGSFWSDLGNSGTTGNTTSGTVTSSSTTTLSGPFTLATFDNGNALPVVLESLDCNVNSFGIPVLTWATSTEVNSDHFDIERSSDGKSFTTAGRINAAGNTEVRREYSFEDNNAPGGKVVYRLKQVDRDGTPTYFEACALDVDASGLIITPNPAEDFASIRLQGASLSELTINNSIGQPVSVPYSVKDFIIELNIAGLAPGIYLVRITTGDNSGVLKLVKQ
jgi:Secretion system C-terminal sorting domain